MLLDELNIPVVKSKPFKFNVPDVSVVVAVASANANWPLKVVIPVLLIVNAAIVLVLDVIVPVPTMVGVKPVYTAPTALDRVRLPAIDNAVVPKLNAVLLKLRSLNQLPVESDITFVPLPVIDKLGALVDEPPVVPNVTVLVTDVASV